MNEVSNHNAKCSIPAWIVGCGLFLLCWSTFTFYYHIKFGLNVPPSTSGDEVDYDSVGWELAHGRGFAVNTEDAEFRKPYDIAAEKEERFRLTPRPHWIITYRPPLYPYTISVLNRLFGRQFWTTRIMDAALMAATLALIGTTLYRSYGLPSVLISAVLFIIVDTRTRLYGRAILTESMSLFFVSLLCVALLRLYRMKSAHLESFYFQSMLIGVVFGFSLLTRTMMITWIPGMVLLLLLISRTHQRAWKDGVVSVLIFGAMLTGLFLPWADRNIEVTGEFMPLGTQGQVQLSAAFGDIIWESQGVWRNLDHEGFFEGVTTPDQSPLQQELAKAEYSKVQALKWLAANPMKSVALIPLKIWEECRPRTKPEFLILLFTLVGIWTTWRMPATWILLAVFGINLMGVAATWSVEGRFLVPLLFPIHILATLGACAVLSRLTGLVTRLPKQKVSP